MLKILLFLGIIAFVVWFFSLKRRVSKDSTSHAVDSMVECKTCKTFVSQKESILSNGSYFCSKECLLKE